MSDEHKADEQQQREWAASVAAHRAALWRFVRRRASSDADADELFATALVRAWEKRATLRDPSKMRPWLYSVARTAVDLQRKSAARRERWIDRSASVEVEAAPSESDAGCACALAQLERLPSAYAEILRRVDLEGDSLSEAAASLSITINNATVRLSRARSALRTRMVEHCGTSTTALCQTCGCEERGCCASHGVEALEGALSATSHP
ncbi:MAG: RNA polymerase sigma factor [Polyangiales bacterium]